MIQQKTKIYPIDNTSVRSFYCILVYKKKEKFNFCFFINMVIKKIRKLRGVNLKKFQKKKSDVFIRKSQRVLGFVLASRRWSLKCDGGGFKVSKNLVLSLKSRSDSTRKGHSLKNAMKGKGISAIKPLS